MPSPTPEQIEEVRMVCRVTSFFEVEGKVNNLSDAGWSATVSDLTEWAKVKNKFSEISGGRIGLKTDKGGKRLEITNRIRVRLGYAEINENGDLLSTSARTDFSESSNVENEVVW